jgi:hypothetical protein
VGTISNTSEFREGWDPVPVSRGGARLRKTISSHLLSASYATGGDTLPIPTDLGTLRQVIISPSTDGTNVYYWNGNAVTPKVKAYVVATGVEVANATSLVTIPVQAFCIFEQ